MSCKIWESLPAAVTECHWFNFDNPPKGPTCRTRSSYCRKHCGAVGRSFMLCSSATPWNSLRQFEDDTKTEQIWTVLRCLAIFAQHLQNYHFLRSWCKKDDWIEIFEITTFTSNQICLTLPNTTVLALRYPMIQRGFDWRRSTSSWWDTPQPSGEWRCRWSSGTCRFHCLFPRKIVSDHRNHSGP